MSYDLVIKNGKIIDGSGLPGFHGDVAVRRHSLSGSLPAMRMSERQR